MQSVHINLSIAAKRPSADGTVFILELSLNRHGTSWFKQWSNVALFAGLSWLQWRLHLTGLTAAKTGCCCWKTHRHCLLSWLFIIYSEQGAASIHEAKARNLVWKQVWNFQPEGANTAFRFGVNDPYLQYFSSYSINKQIKWARNSFYLSRVFVHVHSTYRHAVLKQANKIITDPSHVLHTDYQPRPSERRFRVPCSQLNRFKKLFYPCLNKILNGGRWNKDEINMETNGALFFIYL